uniref:Uncharacterized protein n=1 Tax=Neogobius melanostomus TaxID=47308 RepID=A0A8C6WS96_9GOBI
MLKITVVKEENISQPVLNGITPDKANESPDTENSSDSESDSRSPSLLPAGIPEPDQVSEQGRDTVKEQVHQLQSQLQRRRDASQIDVKEEPQDQHAKERQNTTDYKRMFENARNKINELIKDKEALLAAVEVKPRTDRGDDKEMEEIALQVDHIMRELDERNKEKESAVYLCLKLESAEEEKARLASECESLRLNLQQMKEKAATCRAVDSSAQTDSQENETSPGLIALRHNVGRLLATHHVPALDLDQVNYDCNVIDEILEQVLNDGSQNTAFSDH